MSRIKFLITILLPLLYFTAFTQEEYKEIILSDIFKNSTFNTENIGDLKSMNDGEHYTLLINDSLNIYDYKTGKFRGNILILSKLIPEGKTKAIEPASYVFDPNEKKILFEVDSEEIYRRSSRANYYIYFLSTGKLLPLSENGMQRLAEFSPDGNKVAFVRQNNIFIKDLIKGNETSITLDGKQNSIINGSTDWVYEEEFGFSKAFHWSPDGSQLAYYKFDETQVKEFSFTRWENLYPEKHSYKYPKAGEESSIVSIWVYQFDNSKNIQLITGNPTNDYIPRIKWTHQENTLSIQWLNRNQNELKILFANSLNGDCETIYHEINKYYINIRNNIHFLENKEQFIFTSEEDGYHHMYLYDMLGNLENQITKGEWDVDAIEAIDEKKNTIYFTSGISSPLNRELYAIQLDGSKMRKLSLDEGSHSAQFAKKNNFYINTWSTANTPPIVTVNNAKGKILREITNNKELNKTLQDHQFSTKTFFSFKTSDDVELNGWMIKPPNFIPEKKYPVLMYVYGGPGSQTVRNKWSKGITWYQMLAQKGIIVVSVDNRGTGARGEAFKKSTYLELGKYETLDQIETAHYISKLNYVDSSRIGIWGWSYGGFMSLSCLAQGADIFSMGIAVAPVTDWIYYDNIYTERFMRTPDENSEGYRFNAPINHVSKIKGKLLLIHGTADDNVHLQNSMEMVTALVDANIQFEMQFYPNSNHGIYSGSNTRLHLYTRMTNFIVDNLINLKK